MICLNLDLWKALPNRPADFHVRMPEILLETFHQLTIKFIKTYQIWLSTQWNFSITGCFYQNTLKADSFKVFPASSSIFVFICVHIVQNFLELVWLSNKDSSSTLTIEKLQGFWVFWSS